MNQTIDVENLRVSYYGKEVLKNISFSIDTGKLIGVIGPNGAGKSTMMKAMLGLISRDSGQVTIEEQTVNAVRKKIAYVPQRSNIDRKSTRLNSSHVAISYAVFCLKKKK